MDSFVPFGRFFPTAFESKDLGSCVYPSASRSKHYNDKCEEEVSIICKGQLASIDQQNGNLPFWLRKANTDSLTDGFDAAKVWFLLSCLHSFTLVVMTWSYYFFV